MTHFDIGAIEVLNLQSLQLTSLYSHQLDKLSLLQFLLFLFGELYAILLRLVNGNYDTLRMLLGPVLCKLICRSLHPILGSLSGLSRSEAFDDELLLILGNLRENAREETLTITFLDITKSLIGNTSQNDSFIFFREGFGSFLTAGENDCIILFFLSFGHRLNHLVGGSSTLLCNFLSSGRRRNYITILLMLLCNRLDRSTTHIGNGKYLLCIIRSLYGNTRSSILFLRNIRLLLGSLEGGSGLCV